MDDTYTQQQLARFNVTDGAISLLKEKFSGLTINGVEDKEGYKAVKAARLEVKGYRVDVEKKRKELNSEALKHQRSVNTEAARITALLAPLEDDLHTMEQQHEELLAAIARAKEVRKANETQRKVKALMGFGFRFDGSCHVCDYLTLPIMHMNIVEMPEKEFEVLINNIMFEYHKHMKHKHDIEQREREAKEQAEAKARAEAEKLAIERAELEAQRKAQAEKEAQLKAEFDRLEAEKFNAIKWAEERAKDIVDISRNDSHAPVVTPKHVVLDDWEDDEVETNIVTTVVGGKAIAIEGTINLNDDKPEKVLFTELQKMFVCVKINEWHEANGYFIPLSSLITLKEMIFGAPL